MKTWKSLLPLALALAATVAFATVTYDPSTGKGFVGKGDVQLAFHFNNNQMQKNASAITFEYRTRNTYDVTCEWETVTGRGKIILHDITIPRLTKVDSSVQFEARSQKQVSGFMLTGLGQTTTVGTVPVVGDGCVGGNPGTITAVVDTTPPGTLGGLYVFWLGTGVLLLSA